MKKMMYILIVTLAFLLAMTACSDSDNAVSGKENDPDNVEFSSSNSEGGKSSGSIGTLVKVGSKAQLMALFEAESKFCSDGDTINMNYIDVSGFKDMSSFFEEFEWSRCWFDLSGWDVSNVTDMHLMFSRSGFNGDISGWKFNPACNTCNI